MTTVIDHVLKEWGERLFYKRVKGRKNRNVLGGRSVKKNLLLKSKTSTRDKLVWTIKKTPEVMVKITGSGKHIKQIKNHMDYISRHGKVELEDENGEIYFGKEDISSIRNSWEKGYFGIPKEDSSRGIRESFNIMLSMPPGTHGVKKAVRAFAAERFSEHQYVFAFHEDTKHPHVHLVVKAVDSTGTRLNPRKSDLQQWREHFAEKLREQGIAANATPRRTRGIVRKAKKQALWHIDREGRISQVRKSQKATIIQEIKTNIHHQNPEQARIQLARKETIGAYSEIAKVLSKSHSNDKQLAMGIVKFIQSFPTLKTLHQNTVELVRKQLSLGHIKNDVFQQKNHSDQTK